MRRKANHLRKMETSKLILCGSWAATIILTGLTVLGTFMQVDVTNLTILAGSAWAELTAAHAFYFWKAKNENRAKGTQQMVRDLAEKHGIESVAMIAEIIYKD